MFSYSKLTLILSRLASADITWFLHRLALVLGFQNNVSHPKILLSKFDSSVLRKELKQVESLNVLFFSHNLELEGASISLKELICGLKKTHKISSAVIAFDDGPLRKDYEEQGISVDVLPDVLQRISTKSRLQKEVMLLAQRIKSSKTNLVFANTLLNFPVIMAAEEAGLPSVWNPRESESWASIFRFLPNSVAQQAVAAIGLPRKVVFVARASRDVWGDFVRPDNFLVIPNAIDTTRFAEWKSIDTKLGRKRLNWSEDEIVFLSVGTLCARKGQLDVLKAVELIASNLVYPIHIVFVADIKGSYAKEVQKYAYLVEGHKKIRISFISACSDVGKYYLASDVFLVSSREESYPRTILEALMFSLPIISTPVFGIKEQISDLDYEYYYEPGDFEMLGELILSLANCHKKRQDLRNFSKERFDDLFGYEEMLNTYKDVISEASVVRKN
jgi:hypothetical protein